MATGKIWKAFGTEKWCTSFHLNAISKSCRYFIDVNWCNVVAKLLWFHILLCVWHDQTVNTKTCCPVDRAASSSSADPEPSFPTAKIAGLKKLKTGVGDTQVLGAEISSEGVSEFCILKQWATIPVIQDKSELSSGWSHEGINCLLEIYQMISDK